MLVHRAEEAGFKAIVLTVDTPVPSPKERDLRNQFERKLELGNFRDLGLARNEISGTDDTPGWDVSRADPLTWKDLEWLRGLTSLPLVLKGVRIAEDAKIAADMGVEGILVSTHGGRQLDQTMGAIEMIPEIVDAVKGHCEVYLDSGVRRGSDVLKALSMGVKAVGIGRPVLGPGHRWRRWRSQHPRTASGRGRQSHGLLRPERCGQPGLRTAQHPQQLGAWYGLCVNLYSGIANQKGQPDETGMPFLRLGDLAVTTAADPALHQSPLATPLTQLRPISALVGLADRSSP
jgi:hypothetical protein